MTGDNEKLRARVAELEGLLREAEEQMSEDQCHDADLRGHRPSHCSYCSDRRVILNKLGDAIGVASSGNAEDGE